MHIVLDFVNIIIIIIIIAICILIIAKREASNTFCDIVRFVCLIYLFSLKKLQNLAEVSSESSCCKSIQKIWTTIFLRISLL